MTPQLLLANLGSTAEQVAESLAFWQAKGIQGSAESCPIAAYMANMTQSHATVSMNTLHLQGVDCALQGESFYLPPAIADFVQRFDSGEFSELRL